jgi:HK97 family phage prohead protease
MNQTKKAAPTMRQPLRPPERAIAMLMPRIAPAPPARIIRAPETRDAARSTMERRAYALEVRAAGDDGSIEGYGSVFGELDSYADTVMRGAFAASLEAHRGAGTMPAMLWQHDASQPIGVWSEMAEDERGLRVKGRLVLESERGREAYALLKAGALRGLSIGFMTTDEAYDDKRGVRIVKSVDLWEVSLVTFPALKTAGITRVKSAPVDDINRPSDAERWLRDAAPSVSKSEATALVSRLMRMGAERREAEIATERASRAADRLLRSLTT